MRTPASPCSPTRRAGPELWTTTPKIMKTNPTMPASLLIWGPDGEVLASAQKERVQEEMIVADLDPLLLARERSLANYMLRTRRPELFGELVRDQVSS